MAKIDHCFVTGRAGGPSILDGPAAIARLIDRTRHTDRDNFPGNKCGFNFYSHTAIHTTFKISITQLITSSSWI